MRIAISGSEGTGKSTLSRVLAREFGVPRVREGVRKYMDSHCIDNLRDMSSYEYMKMQWFLLNEKIEQENSLGSFVADRSVADNVAYVLRWCARDFSDAMLDDFIKTAREHAQETYDLILYLPWGEMPIESDGVRSTRKWYQYEIDRLVWGILQDWDMPVVKIGVENRIAWAKFEITRHIMDAVAAEKGLGLSVA